MWATKSIIQNVEYEDPERYRTIACDGNSGNGINTSQKKMDYVSILPITSSLESSTDEPLINGHHVSENTMYENQLQIEIRESRELYLTPTIFVLFVNRLRSAKMTTSYM